MGSVIVLGGLNIDHFIGIPRIPADGDVLTGRSLSVIPGGKGLNQAIAAARLGVNVKLIGCVGHDEAGNMLVTQLIHEGVDTSQVRRSSEHMSGVCYLFVLDNSNEPIGIRVSGANEALSSLEVTASVNSLLAQSATGLSKPVFLGQFGVGKTAIGAGLQAARLSGMTTILNAAPLLTEPMASDMYSLVDVLVVNQAEAAHLIGRTQLSIEDLHTAGNTLLARGPRHVITTLGVNGYIWSSTNDGTSDISHRVFDAIPSIPVNTTGAGDAFCGALAASLADQLPMSMALSRAAAAGSLAVRRLGALPALPTCAQIEALLEDLPTQGE